MKLSDWASKIGVSYMTAYRWYKTNKLPVPSYQTESGTIIVEEENFVDKERNFNLPISHKPNVNKTETKNLPKNETLLPTQDQIKNIAKIIETLTDKVSELEDDNKRVMSNLFGEETLVFDRSKHKTLQALMMCIESLNLPESSDLYKLKVQIRDNMIYGNSIREKSKSKKVWADKLDEIPVEIKDSDEKVVKDMNECIDRVNKDIVGEGRKPISHI